MFICVYIYLYIAKYTMYLMKKCLNDVHSALNEGSAIALMMLDIFAAFDTIHHQILLSQQHDTNKITMHLIGSIHTCLCSIRFEIDIWSTSRVRIFVHNEPHYETHYVKFVLYN